MMGNRSHSDKTGTSSYDRFVRLGVHISWPLLVITLAGLGFIGVTIMLWLQGFDVTGRAPLLLVLVILWFVAEVFIWSVGGQR